MRKIFISYSRADYIDENGVALRTSPVYTILEALKADKQIDIWIDVNAKYSGKHFTSVLAKRIQWADKVLFLSSINSNSSEWVSKEILYAYDNKKEILPVLLDNSAFNVDFALILTGIDYIEYYKNPEQRISDILDNILEDPQEQNDEIITENDSAAQTPNPNQALIKETRNSLKLKADLDCVFFLDGEKHSHLKAGHIQKIPLATGEYELMFVSEDNEHDYVEMEFEMPNVDKLQKVSLIAVRDSRLQKEAEERRVAEEKRQAELRRQAAERKAAEERKREEERKRREEEERKRREEEGRAKERVFRVGGVEFKMIRVEGSTFMMGSPDSDSDAYDVEKPQHRVTLSDYYIGEIPVTQALWQAVMGGNPSYSQGVNNPVECVSWNDCQEFLKKLNQQTGMTFSLPTEVQWEYAARGGNKSKGYKYAGSNSVKDVAWYTDNSGGMTHPVKGKRANELGLYDMSGNVWEWCQDWLGSYSSTPQTNPIGPATGSGRVLRGGDWSDSARDCRVAKRYFNSPGSRGNGAGFRLSLVHPKRESGTVL